MTYLPFIDGLRALSIILVLGWHNMGPVTGFFGRLLHGWTGVEIFFVISGYLITSILLREREQHQDISLKKFYIRRGLRIWPAYYVFLLIFGLLWSGAATFYWPSLVVAALYLSNFDLALGWGYLEKCPLLFITWSLSCEEQYYIVWPLLMKFVSERLIIIIPVLMVLIEVWRAYLVFSGASHERFGSFETKVDSILSGCLAAVVQGRISEHKSFESFLKNRLSAPLVACAIVGCMAWLVPYAPGDLLGKLMYFDLKAPLLNLLSAVFILILLSQPESLFVKLLSTGVLVAIGRLSYSLYLWHAFVIAVCRNLLSGQNPILGEVFTGFACLSVASLSYVVVEKPFLKLKKKFSGDKDNQLTPV